jgi:hypothetical protein
MVKRIGVFSVVWLVAYSVIDLATPYDDTDDIENGKRSGMRLFTDNLTGCQYLQAGLFGGMSPRYDREGNHIGCN